MIPRYLQIGWATVASVTCILLTRGKTEDKLRQKPSIFCGISALSPNPSVNRLRIYSCKVIPASKVSTVNVEEEIRWAAGTSLRNEGKLSKLTFLVLFKPFLTQFFNHRSSPLVQNVFRRFRPRLVQNGRDWWVSVALVLARRFYTNSLGRIVIRFLRVNQGV